MVAVLIGFGEIGQGMYNILSGTHDIAIYDHYKQIRKGNLGAADILLIAIPWTDEFNAIVDHWRARVDPISVIIFSTVPIGTCKGLGACHFPIEAKHPFIERDIRLNKKCWFGGTDRRAIQFLEEAGLKFRILPDSNHTEFLKLRSTSLYGINLEFARYSACVAKELGLDYEHIIQYDQDHNDLVVERGTPEHIRYILTPPQGMIGGHCVVPNARILDSQFPSLFLKEIYREKKDE